MSKKSSKKPAPKKTGKAKPPPTEMDAAKAKLRKLRAKELNECNAMIAKALEKYKCAMKSEATISIGPKGELSLVKYPPSLVAL